MGNFLDKLKDSLSRTRDEMMVSLKLLLPYKAELTETDLEKVEEVLYEADLGIHAVEMIIESLRERIGDIRLGEADSITVMKEAVLRIAGKFGDPGLKAGSERPYIIFVIGVNGSGKTTTIGKLAHRFRTEGKSVLLAACDTYRAAAIEQLEVWAKRSDAEFIKSSLGADAAALAFDAVARAKARGTDILIIDTAGRLHTSRNLMEELKKIHKVVGKAMEEAPHETLLVLDSTNGQNALAQAEIFNRELGVTGVALTKLDGTAKGGIAVSVIDRLDIPVKLVGTGEGIDDLRDFDPAHYAEALFTAE